MWKRVKKIQNRKKWAFNYRNLSIASIILLAVMTLFGVYQMREYENSVLDIYAGQQDAYVQLVLDQINLQEDRTDQEIIENILNSLDSSGQKYWTLSKNQSLLFVKDVTETNRYKGFTTATYFASKSAINFLNGLQMNKVIHQTIRMDGNRYVASGVVFEYNGAQYKISLLTNDSIILDSNAFLASKIAIYTFIVVLLILAFLTVMILGSMVDTRNQRIQALSDRIEQQNREITRLEETIRSFEMYNTRFNIFQNHVLKPFVEKLSKRHVFPVTFALLYFELERDKKDFLQQAQLLLDEKVIRFTKDKKHLVFLFIQYKPAQARSALLRVPSKRMMIEKIDYVDENTQPIEEVSKAFLSDKE